MIFNLGGAAFETPELNPNYPNDVSDHYIEGESKSATFEVRISKDGFPDEYAYQWYVDDSAVDGATERTYTRTGLTEGVYSIYCEVTNAAGTVQSRTATLEVTLYTTPVLDASYPTNKEVTYISSESKSASFEVVITTNGVPALYAYQWYVNDSAVDGATERTYTRTGLTEGVYSIYCEVTNAAGTVQSRTATLTVTLYKTPVLNSSYPANVTQVEKENGSATFTVAISTAGVPDSYTYQWYVNGSAVSGATGSSYTKTGLTSVATYTVYCRVTNAAGTVQSRTATLTVQNSQPTYTYSGSHQLIKDGVGNWRIKLKSSGTLRFTYFGAGNGSIDVFCVGGGSGSNTFTGGGGGKTKTASSVKLSLNTNYSVTIGGGGAALSNGGRSGFNNNAVYADGGTASSSQYYGGSGGSGGAGYGNDGQGPQASNKNLNGGSNGSAGGTYNPNYPGGSGQGTTTREFGETSGTLYAGGGAGRYSFAGTSSIDGTGGSGGGGNVGAAGGTNTGGGGGASTGTNPNVNVGVPGGSGIVVIRNHR